MIDKVTIEDIANQYIADYTQKENQYQLIEVNVSASNEICVTLDAATPIDIEFCVNLSRYIEQHLDREKEDYSLEVGSAGLTDPLKTPFQYRKNIGNEVVVVLKDGKRLKGTLVDATDKDFSVDTKVQVEVENKKRKQTQVKTLTWSYADAKSVCYDLKV